MSNQVQCPNCGRYKIDTQLTQIDPETGKKFKRSFETNLLLITVGLVIFGFVTIGAGASGPNKVSLVMGIILWIGLLVWVGDKEKKRVHNRYNYSCNLCGYQWGWREGSPYPKVNVHPELIAQGEKMLEEKNEGNKTPPP